MTDLRTAIKAYLALGLSLIPIRPREKRPLTAWEDWSKVRPDTETWVGWWKEFRGQLNLAVVYSSSKAPAGKQLVCCDTDTEEVEAWVRSQADPSPTPTVKTAKGYHRYYLAPADLEHSAGGEDRPEIRAGVHYSLLPPSIHPTGAVYSWCDGLSLEDVPLADLPAWGVALMGKPEVEAPVKAAPAPQGNATSPEEKYVQAALDKEVAELAAAPQGQRNTALNNAAFSLGQLVGGGCLDEVVVSRALLGACQANGLVKDDGLRACETSLNSGLTAGKAKPRTAPEPRVLPVPDPTTAEELAKVHGATQARPQPEDEVATDEEALANLLEVAERNVNRTRAHETKVPLSLPPARLSEVAGEMIEGFEDYRKGPRIIRGLRTGLRSLDNHFLGFWRQQLIIVQGLSGYGKTLFSQHCIFATALAEEQLADSALTIVFLCESTKQQLMSAYLGYRWGLPLEVREPGSEDHITEEFSDRLMAGYSEFPTLPVAVHDEVKDIAEIEAHVRTLVSEGPVAGVVIDHAQEIEVPRCRNRHEELCMVAVRFRDLADKLRVPIMLLSQTTLKDGNHEPEYSKALRQKSSLCFVVSRGRSGMSREQAVQSNETRIICDKSRWVRVPPVLSLFGDYRTGRLWEGEDYARLQASDQPEKRMEWHDN